jgi:nucleotidyltransferase/DNA polymerase involved in DNA repair
MKTIDPLDERSQVLRELREIPGIGPSLASDLYSLGIRRIADLKRKNPETLYRQLERQTGEHQDRCVLYTFRCAVYYAKTPKPKARLLQWWNWMDAAKQSKRQLL